MIQRACKSAFCVYPCHLKIGYEHFWKGHAVADHNTMVRFLTFNISITSTQVHFSPTTIDITAVLQS